LECIIHIGAVRFTFLRGDSPKQTNA
jgi:hypothetical protein